jgi:hypothetical protein
MFWGKVLCFKGQVRNVAPKYHASTIQKKNSTDPWKPQRKFWEDLSKSMAAVMAPSWLIILDESMSAWTGRGFQGATEYKEGFCPHKS